MTLSCLCVYSSLVRDNLLQQPQENVGAVFLESGLQGKKTHRREYEMLTLPNWKFFRSILLLCEMYSCSCHTNELVKNSLSKDTAELA